jgi:hypothetical protein
MFYKGNKKPLKPQESSHHNHSCTLAHVASLGARRVLVSLRHPTARYISGFQRRLNGLGHGRSFLTLGESGERIHMGKNEANHVFEAAFASSKKELGKGGGKGEGPRARAFEDPSVAAFRAKIQDAAATTATVLPPEGATRNGTSAAAEVFLNALRTRSHPLHPEALLTAWAQKFMLPVVGFYLPPRPSAHAPPPLSSSSSPLEMVEVEVRFLCTPTLGADLTAAGRAWGLAAREGRESQVADKTKSNITSGHGGGSGGRGVGKSPLKSGFGAVGGSGKLPPLSSSFMGSSLSEDLLPHIHASPVGSETAAQNHEPKEASRESPVRVGKTEAHWLSEVAYAADLALYLEHCGGGDGTGEGGERNDEKSRTRANSGAAPLRDQQRKSAKFLCSKERCSWMSAS